jgi:RNA polymerase sigma factor (sigma-70 family)
VTFVKRFARPDRRHLALSVINFADGAHELVNSSGPARVSDSSRDGAVREQRRVNDAVDPIADDRRLADLYRQHWGELYAYVKRTFGRGPPEPEDVAQSAFAQFAARPDWRDLEHPRAFLYRVAHNLVIDFHRSEAVRSRFVKERVSARSNSDDLHAERVISAKEQLSIVETALSYMEPKRRAVFVLNRIHELSFAEIGRRMNMPETTVKRHVSAAVVECLRALRERGLKDERPWR